MKCLSLLVSLAVLLLSSPAFAHKMMAYWEVESTVHLEVFFADGTPAKGVEVKVLGEDGTLLVEGRTDKEGRFSFRPAGDGPYTAICQETLGHRTEVKIDVKGRAEQKKGRAEEEIPLREVFAGFGYIFGAAGVLMWIFSRRKAKRR